MSAVGVEETQEHHFQDASLAVLGADVDAFVASALGDWRLESVRLDTDVRRLENGLGETVRTRTVYTAAVTLTRWRNP